MDDIVRHSPVNVTRQKPQPQPRIPVSVRTPSRPYRREHERHNLSSILTAVIAVFLAYLAFRTLTTPKESTIKINMESPIPSAKVTDSHDQYAGVDKEDILATKFHDTIESTKEKGKKLVDEAKDISEDVFENVKEKGEIIFEKAKERGEDILEKAKGKGEIIFEKAKEKGEDVFEILKEKSEDAYEKGKGMWKESKEKIREVKDQSEDVFERMKEKGGDLLSDAKENILEKLEINKNMAQQRYEGAKEKSDDVLEKVREKSEDTFEKGKDTLKDAKGKFSAGLESTKEKLHEAKEKGNEILGEIKEKVVSVSEKAEQLRDKFHGIDRTTQYTTLKPFNPWGINMLGSGCELLHCGKDQLCYSLRNLQLMCTTVDIACSTLSKDLCEKESRCGLNYGRSTSGQDTLTFCRAKEASCHSEKPACGLHPTNGMMYYFNDGCLPISRNIYSLKENGPQFQKSEVCF